VANGSLTPVSIAQIEVSLTRMAKNELLVIFKLPCGSKWIQSELRTFLTHRLAPIFLSSKVRKPGRVNHSQLFKNP
jgi:hypothetical protein